MHDLIGHSAVHPYAWAAEAPSPPPANFRTMAQPAQPQPQRVPQHQQRVTVSVCPSHRAPAAALPSYFPHPPPVPNPIPNSGTRDPTPPHPSNPPPYGPCLASPSSPPPMMLVCFVSPSRLKLPSELGQRCTPCPGQSSSVLLSPPPPAHPAARPLPPP